MATANHPNPTAVAYAQALLDLAAEQHQEEAIAQELRDVRDVIAGYPAFGEYLRDPAIGLVERQATLQKAMQGRVSPLMWNFVRVLAGKGRAGLLADLSTIYDALLARRQGRVDVDVTVACELTGEQLEQVRHRVSEALGKHAVVRQHVDESIIGGVVLKVEDRVIDASVRQQLRALRERLLAARPKSAGALTA